MRLVLVVTALLVGCATNSTSAVSQQLRDLTKQQRASFAEPGDAVSMSPTPDTGIFGQGDATHDCSGCPAR